MSRTKKKMSQQELSEKAGTHQKNISKYETDLLVPSAITMKVIADTLGATTDYQLGDENAGIKDMALLKQFIEVDNLPETEKSSLNERNLC
jgi:transcriptional regulator with XRE-family HTH domain